MNDRRRIFGLLLQILQLRRAMMGHMIRAARRRNRLLYEEGVRLCRRHFERNMERLFATLLAVAVRVITSSDYLYLVVAVALLAAVTMGYALGYTSPALPDMKDAGILNDDTEPVFGSLLNIGAIFGGPIAGFLLGYVGRKATLMLCAVPFTIGWALIASVPQLWGLYLGRILTGLATGMTSLSCPVYIAELASPSNRGFLGSSFQLCVTVGVLLAFSLGVFLSYIWLALVSAVIALVMAVAMLPMPDTPSFWLIRNDRQRAMTVLRKLRGSDTDVDVECREIESTLDESDNTVSFREFLQPHLLMPLLISLALMFFQQFSGINTVMFYTVEIFQSTGSTIDAHLAAIIIGAVQVVATFVSVLLMDRLGRKVLLITAGSMMAVSSTTFGLYYFLTDGVTSANLTTMIPPTAQASDSLSLPILTPEQAAGLGWLSLTSMIVYIIGFSLGLGPIPWLIMSEIFPSKARGVASSIATAFNWTCSFIITLEFQNLEKSITKQGVFWMYAIVCILEVIFVAMVVPETKGKSLEEIEEHFRKKE